MSENSNQTSIFSDLTTLGEDEETLMEPEEPTCRDADRLLQVTKFYLESLKDELLQKSLAKLQTIAKETDLKVIARDTFDPIEDAAAGTSGTDKVGTTYMNYLHQIGYIRKIINSFKLFPTEIVINAGPNLLEISEKLIQVILEEYVRSYRGSGIAENDDSIRQHRSFHFTEYGLMPAIQLAIDCLELKSTELNEISLKMHSSASKLFSDIGRFAISQEGLSLERQHYLRILALLQKLGKFMLPVDRKMLKDWNKKDENKEDENTDLFKTPTIESVEGALRQNIAAILSSCHGLCFIKFWCEYWLSIGSERFPDFCLKRIVEMNESQLEKSEIYLVLSCYLQNNDTWFWKRGVGKELTPILIRSLRHDLLSMDTKAECRKRAAFCLKGITTLYSIGCQLFDAGLAIPETSYITLNDLHNRDATAFSKFWADFFNLYDILDETQFHIVEPNLHKLDIFFEHLDNWHMFVWLPILLTKLITHDNRAIIKEGLERFLRTGQCFNLQQSNAYRLMAEQFLEDHIFNIIRDQIGWVFNQPEDFFKNASAFGLFLVQLYSDQQLPHFVSVEKMLIFMTSSKNCMSPHTILFLITAANSAFGRFDSSQFIDSPLLSGGIIKTYTESTISLLSCLLSNNVTSVSRFFRDQLERECVNIFSSIAPLIPFVYPEIHADNELFEIPTQGKFSSIIVKLLKFLGSLSGKILYEPNVRKKIEGILNSFVGDGHKAYNILLSENMLRRTAKENLSSLPVIGLFRLLIIGCKTGNLKYNLQKFIEKFVELDANNLLPESVDGIKEYFAAFEEEDDDDEEEEEEEDDDDDDEESYVKVLESRIISEISKPVPVNIQTFLTCVRYLEILSAFPPNYDKSEDDNLDITQPTKIIFVHPVRLFLLRKLFLLNPQKQDQLKYLEKNYRLSYFPSPGEIRKSFSYLDSSIHQKYNDITGRKLIPDFYELQFATFTRVISLYPKVEVSAALQLDMLQGTLSIIEICNPKGVSAALGLAKAIMTFVDIEQSKHSIHYETFWKTLVQLRHLATVGWKLMFEQRKNESFWTELQAFVEFICHPIFVFTGDLKNYGDRMLKEGEAIWGIPFVYIKQLVKVDFPQNMLEYVHAILLKAAISGAPLSKTHRFSFSLWDYIRSRDESLKDEDPEHFSSDCKSRVLACRKLYSSIRTLISKTQMRDVGNDLLKKIVHWLLEQNDLESKTKSRYFGGSATHRLKQRIFQCLLMLQPFFNQELSDLVLLRTLRSISTDSPQPSVRYLGEWLVIRILKKHPMLQSAFFSSLDECMKTRAGYGAFFATICLHVSKQLSSTDFNDQSLQLLTSLIFSQHVTVRIYAQVAFNLIYEQSKKLEFITLVEKYSPVVKALQAASAHVSGNCLKISDNVSNDFYVNVFDSQSHYCPEVVFSLLPRISDMIKDECILQPESVRALFPIYGDVSGQNTVDTEMLAKTYEGGAKSWWHLKTVVADGRELGEEYPAENLRKSNEKEEMNFQKKINPWKLLSVSDEIHDYKDIGAKMRCVSEDGLIVVASLLENLPNMGGLCRTCEIFGVQKYVVNTLKVINELQFQNLSVSAQNWVNIQEVPTRDLENFLLTYATKGYTILGVEQSNNSCSLTNFKFPKKAVLLLGNEKQGIPSDLLRLVDQCIEIPQVGIIRSLNVHVTGALCVYQYASQHVL